MIPVCSFLDVSEHDMDLLIMEEFVCNSCFRQIFLNKIEIKECVVDKAYHSLADSNGESDITFIIDVNGVKYGIFLLCKHLIVNKDTNLLNSLQVYDILLLDKISTSCKQGLSSVNMNL